MADVSLIPAQENALQKVLRGVQLMDEGLREIEYGLLRDDVALMLDRVEGDENLINEIRERRRWN